MFTDVVTQIGFNYFSLAIIVAFILVISEATTAAFGWSIGDLIEFKASMEVNPGSWLGRFFAFSKIGDTPSIIPIATFLLTFGMFGLVLGMLYSSSGCVINWVLRDLGFILIPILIGALAMCVVNKLVYRLVPREASTKIRYQSELVGHNAVMIGDATIGVPAKARLTVGGEVHFVRVEPTTHTPILAGQRVQLLKHLGSDTFRGGTLD